MKVIVVGATSGIGKSLAEKYANEGFKVGITGRRKEILDEMKAERPAQFHITAMDVSQTENAIQALKDLIAEMNGVDVIIINAGVGFDKATLQQELKTVEVNVLGFTALARFSYDYFVKMGKGHLVGVSSVAAVRSSPFAPEYHASKAFMSSYMEGLRLRSAKWNPSVKVTDIRPGFVETAMTESNKKMFWVAKPEVAASYMVKAIQKQKKVAYITPRYWFLAQFLKIVPEWLITKLI